MARKKVEIKRIEDKYDRRATFSKRKSGLFNKAKKFSISCDVQIAAIVFSDRNKLYQFSYGNSLAAILQQCHEVSSADEMEATVMHKPKNSARSQANGNLLERVRRYLDELNLDSLSVADLAQLEKELESGLVKTRATKDSVNTQHMMEPTRILQEKEKLLREENKLLTQQIAAMSKENIAAKEMDYNTEVDIEFRNLDNNQTDHSPPLQTLWLLC